MNLSDKTVLVTGAGTGIGAATVLAMAEAGAAVAAADLNEGSAQQTASKAAQFGHKTLAIKGRLR